MIGANAVWNTGFSGAGQTIAILDTGVDRTHPFLAGRVVSEACYSTSDPINSVLSLCPNGATQQIGTGSGVNCPLFITGCQHGTHVAGIAAGREYTGTPFSGVAKDATLIAIQVFSRHDSINVCGLEPIPCARTYTSDYIRGLQRVYDLRNTYAIAAVNMSLGGAPYYSSSSGCDSANTSTKSIIDTLRSVGIATVVSSGNDATLTQLPTPACISTAVSVGSVTGLSTISHFSNSASWLSLLAPGGDGNPTYPYGGGGIQSSIPAGGFELLSGTSMAAPHVAGAWAILKSKKANASVSELLTTLTSTGTPILDTRNGIVKPMIRVDLAAATLPAPPPAPPGVSIDTGGYHSCGVISGALRCWGNNAYGGLGNGTTTNSTTGVPVSGISTATSVSTGALHTCARLSDSTVRCWGYNYSGQLGDGTTTHRLTPVSVSNLGGAAIAIATGSFHTCALLSGGTVRCWGQNNYGQLGDGTTTNRPTPVSVSNLGGTALAITADGSHTCALLSTASVRCWGYNPWGQLGNGTKAISVTTPVTVSGISSATAVAAGGGHTCARLSNSTVRCWGRNQYGQLGNGTMSDATTPVTVSGISTASAISGGGSHTCAILADSTVRCWGYNSFGQLGNGTTTNATTPVTVSGINTATGMSAGGHGTCSRLSDGTARCWGFNNYGQLGNGTTTNSSIPVVVQ
ncbi:MAG: S8 family serine peptidase [Nitrospirota bacterium]